MEEREMMDDAMTLGSLWEQNEAAVQRFTQSLRQVKSAYEYSMGRMEEALTRIRASFTAIAAVGLSQLRRGAEAVAPVFQRLAEICVQLFGVTYWQQASRGADSVTASVRRAGAAARELGDLMSFDEINRLSITGGGGGGSGGEGGGRQGEWVHIPGLLEQWAERGAEIMAQIWEPFRQAWQDKGEKVLLAAEEMLRQIWGLCGELGRSWLSIWSSGAGQRAVGAVLDIAAALMQTVGNLAAGFRTAWQSGEQGSRIMQELFDLGLAVLNTLRDMAQTTQIWSSQVNFSPILQGFASLTAGARQLAETVGGMLSAAYRTVLLPIAGWTIQEALPGVLALLSEAFLNLNAVLNLLRPAAAAVWENVLKPMGRWTAEGLVTVLSQITGGLRTMRTAMEGLPGVWNSLQTRASDAWNRIKNSIVGACTSARSSGVTSLSGMVSQLSSKMTEARNVMGQKAQEIVQRIQSGFSAAGDALRAPFRNGLNAVIELVNRVIRKINNSLKFSWDPIVVMGVQLAPGGSVRLANMKTIPKLAEGGIVRSASLALIGEAGREAVLPLEQNTGWMDQLAQRLTEQMGYRQGEELRLQVYIGGEQIADQVVRQVNQMTKQTGVCPIYL